MSSLSSTAAEILALVEGPRVHHDPKVCREILKTDIENALVRMLGRLENGNRLLRNGFHY